MDDRLKQIKQRVKAATPGPWKAMTSTEAYNAGHPFRLAQVGNYESICPPIELNLDDMSASIDDAAFIAAARDDVPWLIEQLEAAEERVAHLEAQMNALPGTAEWMPEGWVPTKGGAYWYIDEDNEISIVEVRGKIMHFAGFTTAHHVNLMTGRFSSRITPPEVK